MLKYTRKPTTALRVGSVTFLILSWLEKRSDAYRTICRDNIHLTKRIEFRVVLQRNCSFKNCSPSPSPQLRRRKSKGSAHHEMRSSAMKGTSREWVKEKSSNGTMYPF
ncbi:hypothetical protein SCHPADRAFT_328607 [Schizopora paradoxa]|uniref:Uncharacterized protein n=1 Tax=Schizopora paradoxa TaxID=27342 RepID=A0A0H2RQ72_9AGAM|nr:hypothetical protein SCHPADRAFT_328607 [Schizopora paradoxa]